MPRVKTDKNELDLLTCLRDLTTVQGGQMKFGSLNHYSGFTFEQRIGALLENLV